MLDDRACNVAGKFNSREIAKTLWAFATLEVKPGKRLVILLEKQACRVVEKQSTPQDIAYMLWAYRTLKIEPWPGLVAALERRACAAAPGDFTPQEIANTLWGYAEVMKRIIGRNGRKHRKETVLLVDAMERQVAATAGNFTRPYDIANTLWGYAKLRKLLSRAGDERPPREGLEAFLHCRVLAVAAEYQDPQEIASTLYAFAKLGVKPEADLLAALEARAVAAAGNFTSKAIRNMIWAYATLGVRPGLDLVAKMEVRACALMDQSLEKEISNMLWAYGVLGFPPGNEFTMTICQAVCGRLLNPNSFNSRGLQQLHLFLLAAKLEGWFTVGDSSPIDDLHSRLGSRGHDLIAQSPAIRSKLQADVASCVRRLELAYEEEAIDERSGYSIDLLLAVSHSGECCNGDAVGTPGRVAIEVDGPWHFLLPGGRQPSGNTMLKRRILSMLGYKMVSVPHWEWYNLTVDHDQDAYLRSVLRMS